MVFYWKMWCELLIFSSYFIALFIIECVSVCVCVGGVYRGFQTITSFWYTSVLDFASKKFVAILFLGTILFPELPTTINFFLFPGQLIKKQLSSSCVLYS